jgi:hypothetical protein
MVWSHLLVSRQRLLDDAHGYPHLILDTSKHLVSRPVGEEGRDPVPEALAHLEQCGAGAGHHDGGLGPAVRLWLLERRVQVLYHFGGRLIRVDD